MFNIKKSGKGVVNGNWYVYFYTRKAEEKIISFHNEEYEAADKATVLNEKLLSFIESLLK